MTMVSEWSPALRFGLLLAVLHCWADHAMTEQGADQATTQLMMAPTWSSWSNFSECTATCGPGVSYRARLCMAPSGGEAECVGPAHEHKECNTEVCPPCEAGWLQAGNTCYRYVPGYRTQSAALAKCRTKGGTLPQPTSIEHGLQVSDVVANTVGLTTWYWLGLVKSNATWQWVDGCEATYTNWAPDEPKGDRYCAITRAMPGNENYGKWIDVGCHWKWYTICERPITCEASRLAV